MSRYVNVKEYVKGMHHVGFFCADIEETVEFYTSIFGFEVLLYGKVEIANERVAMLKLGNFILEVLWVPELSKEELNERALKVDNHFSIMVSDIDAVKAELLKHPEIKFEEEEIRNVPNIGDMDLRVTFFRGINGERVEIMQNTKEK